MILNSTDSNNWCEFLCAVSSRERSRAAREANCENTADTAMRSRQLFCRALRNQPVFFCIGILLFMFIACSKDPEKPKDHFSIKNYGNKSIFVALCYTLPTEKNVLCEGWHKLDRNDSLKRKGTRNQKIFARVLRDRTPLSFEGEHETRDFWVCSNRWFRVRDTAVLDMVELGWGLLYAVKRNHLAGQEFPKGWGKADYFRSVDGQARLRILPKD